MRVDRVFLSLAVFLVVLFASSAARAAGPGEPVIVGQSVAQVEPRSALVEARIDPSGYATTCQVQYVSEESFRASGWAEELSEPCSSTLAAGPGEQGVAVTLRGLSVSVAYHYRFLASNQAGDVTGSEGRFATFGIESFGLEALGEHGEPVRQAGAHPYELVTKIMLNTTPRPGNIGNAAPLGLVGVLRDARVQLPAGLIGDPTARELCSDYEVESKQCPSAAQVGTIAVIEGGGIAPRTAPLFDVVPPEGVAARFAARVNAVANATIDAHIRSGEDYGIEADSLDITGYTDITGIVVKMWGLPEAASHDPERACPLEGRDEYVIGGCAATDVSPRPFLSMPTSCQGPLVGDVEADSYQAAGDFAPGLQEMPAITGCGAVGFAPSLQAATTSEASDSPTGLNIDLHVPQNEEPAGVRTADLRNATITLPAGLVVNPSSASGLQGCSPSQAGLETTPNDIQRITVQPREDHSFTLSYEGQETSAISALATAGMVQSALEALPGIGTGNVVVSGGDGGAFTIEFLGALAGHPVAQLGGSVSRSTVQNINVHGLSSSSSVGTFALTFAGKSTEASVTATAHIIAESEETREIGYIEESSITGRTGTLVSNEVITGPGLPSDTRITVQNGRIVLYSDHNGSFLYTTGEYTGTFTVSLPDDAYAQTVQDALEALPGIGANVNVTGNPEEFEAGEKNSVTYTVVFTGALASEETQALGIAPVLESAKQELSVVDSAPSVRPLTVTTIRAGGEPHLNGEPASCPPGSKLGTVEIHTPLLGHPLEGGMYLATPRENPFHSLLALYLAVHDPISGVVIKLAGKIEANQQTGQLTATFDQNPQLPFEDLEVDLFGANEQPGHSRASLTTPIMCGAYSVTSTLEPWSHPGATGEEGTPSATPSSDPFQITEGCAASQESEAPNKPSFEAGTASPIGGSYSPFVLKLSREDGSQRFSALNVTLPPGLLGKVAGIEQCSQADIEAAQRRSHEGEGALEQSSPSCPSGSKVGVVHVGAGSGAPYYVTGQAYFAGPYGGAPFSLVIVTPAIAGPFDLGTVVVRAGLFINPSTAQVMVKSDPFPTILDGIPLDIRTIGVEMNRSDFTLNPTSCETMAIAGEETSTTSQTAGLSSRFKAEGCTSLPFHPSFTASTQGSTSKADGASLKVNVGSAGVGQADIAKVQLTIPKVMPARLTTLQQACTEAQFNANPAGCPAASNIGSAIVHTPILASPLAGPAYIVSHGGAAFPDVEMVLQGEGVTLVLDGHTDIKSGVTYSKFEAVPDAPFTSFEFNAPEGPYSIFTTENPGKTNLCATSTTKTVTVKEKVKVKTKHGGHKTVTRKVKKTEKVAQSLTIPTTLVGQNGVVVTQQTQVAVTGCPKAASVKKAGKKKQRQAQKRHKKGGGKKKR